MREYQSDYNYYQDGNTVRRQEVVYVPRERVQRRRESEARQMERQRREARLKAQKLANQKHMWELRKNRITAAFMVLVAALFCGIFAQIVTVKGEITTTMQNIAKLESAISDINADNKAVESRIATTVDLAEIRQVATTGLGMVYASSDQIVYYTMDNQDYMTQYYDIP